VIVDGHDCHFDADAHTYQIDGVEVVSVTQALVESSMVDTKWFTEWARHRGSTVHRAVELLIKGTLKLNSIDPRIQGYLDAYERFRDDTGFECFETERRVWAPTKGFAGTLDQLGAFRGATTAIVDVKTGALGWQVGIQLSGYSDGYHLETGNNVDRLVGLRLKVDGTYTMKRYVPEHLDWRAALRVAQRKRRG
jgi:hypothetical protein